MNGRVFAVNRSPVLAWNVEVPYPDMPAAAAAAISPIVPTASDPYSRCWQNQVDPSSSFPYFGALYNNSLPPTAYRLQPGCMPNLGQFWPPTPPPDGCGRFDGNNIYFGPPVLRHGENVSSNIRNSFQSLGHYSHLVDTPKESNPRLFKQETSISPNVSSSNIGMCSSAAKSDSLNTCCIVDSKLKSQCSVSRSLPKQELLTVSSGHEPYFFAPDIRSSSSMHPSTDKSCFSSTYSLKSNLSIHSPPQENAHKSKSLSGTQENNCNASPLKNVYFSHCENVNSMQSKNFEKNSDEHLYLERKNHLFNSNKSRPQSSSDYLLSNHFSKKYDFHSVHDFHKTVSNQRTSDISLLKEQYKQKSCSSKIKPEKMSHSDCKYQKSNSRSSSMIQISDCNNSDVLNIPTSVMHPKLEPKDKYFMSSCPSTASSCMASSYASSSSPYLMSNSLSNASVNGYQNNLYQNPCSLNKSWSYNELPMINPEIYFKSPEAAKPPSQSQPHVSSALHEGLISVAQTAPSDIQIVKEAGNLCNQTSVSPIHQKKVHIESDDDDVQIIGVQTKSFSAKQSARYSSMQNCHHSSSSIIKPLCLKSENKEFHSEQYVSTSEDQNLNTVHSLVERSDCIFNSKPIQTDCKAESELGDNSKITEDIETTDHKVVEPKSFAVSTVKVKEEVNENLPTTSNVGEILPVSSNSFDSETKEETAAMTEPSIESSKNILSDPETAEKVQLEPSTIVDINAIENCKVEVKEVDIGQESLSEFSENHGLNLLLDTIEKVTSFETYDSTKSKFISKTLETIEDSNVTKKILGPSCNVLKTRGLELLSTIAVERLVSEFDVIKIQPKDSPVISNYPQIKEELKLVSEGELGKQNGENVVKALKSTVFEMQDRLAELQKKYKQKQKELSRLKPKKRLANAYLKCCHKMSGENADAEATLNASSGTGNDSLNVSISSCACSDSDLQKSEKTVDEPLSELKVNNDESIARKRPKRNQRSAPFRKESSIEILSDEDIQEIYVHKQTTRRSSRRNSLKILRSNLERKRLSMSMHSKSIKHSQRNKFSRIRKKKKNFSGPVSDVKRKFSSGNCHSSKTNSLPESIKKSKAYSLRHLSQVSMTSLEPESENLDLNSKTLSSKRKSDNPKRYVPSKQGKMSETIIAKHLRSRILFDTSGPVSDEENAKDSVPDELYDALMKCHLVEENQGKTFSDESETSCDIHLLGHPVPSKLNPENLVERHRLLALEDGLFYAGYIKECQTNNRYGIALDGQRGNRLHIFTREELLTQTIIESKPVTSELPEGTRVCAYWSQQYRCLYPGVIGKAPCPSADWSEPRVFVQFDDGDSGQIPTKNVRLIPHDIIASGPESRLDSSSTSSTHSDFKSKDNRSQMPRRLRSSTPKKKHRGITNENESKESSCTSINDSSCDDSCFMDYSLSPSHKMETLNSIDNNQPSNNNDYSKPEKRQRKHSKRKIASRTKSRDIEYSEVKGKSEAKSKRHKKYKDKHRRHHHHHHRHHHHHHHHHHSKKRKHRKKNGKSPTSQDLEYENCIPCKSNLKSHMAFDVACTDLIEHSSTIHLPQSEQVKK